MGESTPSYHRQVCVNLSQFNYSIKSCERLAIVSVGSVHQALLNSSPWPNMDFNSAEFEYNTFSSAARRGVEVCRRGGGRRF